MGIYNLNAISQSTDYSANGNYLPSVDGTFGLALAELKFVAKMGKAQGPGYAFKVEVVESDSPKVIVGRKYDETIALAGSEFDMLAGVKRLASFIGAFAGVEPNTPFDAEQYLTDDGKTGPNKGKWLAAANAGKLGELGLMATLARRMRPTKKGGMFPRDTWLPFQEG